MLFAPAPRFSFLIRDVSLVNTVNVESDSRLYGDELTLKPTSLHDGIHILSSAGGLTTVVDW